MRRTTVLGASISPFCAVDSQSVLDDEAAPWLLSAIVQLRPRGLPPIAQVLSLLSRSEAIHETAVVSGANADTFDHLDPTGVPIEDSAGTIERPQQSQQQNWGQSSSGFSNGNTQGGSSGGGAFSTPSALPKPQVDGVAHNNAAETTRAPTPALSAQVQRYRPCVRRALYGMLSLAPHPDVAIFDPSGQPVEDGDSSYFRPDGEDIKPARGVNHDDVPFVPRGVHRIGAYHEHRLTLGGPAALCAPALVDAASQYEPHLVAQVAQQCGPGVTTHDVREGGVRCALERMGNSTQSKRMQVYLLVDYHSGPHVLAEHFSVIAGSHSSPGACSPDEFMIAGSATVWEAALSSKQRLRVLAAIRSQPVPERCLLWVDAAAHCVHTASGHSDGDVAAAWEAASWCAVQLAHDLAVAAPTMPARDVAAFTTRWIDLCCEVAKHVAQHVASAGTSTIELPSLPFRVDSKPTSANPLPRGGSREWPEPEASSEEVAALTMLQSDATQLACLQVECLKRCMEVLVCDGWRRGSRVAHLVDTIHSLSVGKRRGVHWWEMLTTCVWFELQSGSSHGGWGGSSGRACCRARVGVDAGCGST